MNMACIRFRRTSCAGWARLYRTLRTAGITAATFAHESRDSPIKVIKQSVDVLARRGREIPGG